MAESVFNKRKVSYILMRIHELFLSVISKRDLKGSETHLQGLIIFVVAAIGYLLLETYLVPLLTALACAIKNDPESLKTFWTTWSSHALNGWAYLRATWPDYEVPARILSLMAGAVIVAFAFIAFMAKRKTYSHALFGIEGEKDGIHGSGHVETSERILRRTSYVWNPDGPRPLYGGMVYGYSYRWHRYYISRPEAHTMVIAPPGTGKTVLHLLPALHSFLVSEKSSVVCFDPQRELYDATHEYAEDLGIETIVFDYRRTEGSDRYNPLHEIQKRYFSGLDEWENLIAEAAQASFAGRNDEASELCMKADNVKRSAEADAESLARDAASIFIPKLPNEGDAAFWKEGGQGLVCAVSLLVATYREDDWIAESDPPLAPDPEQRSMSSVLYVISEFGGEIREQSGGKVVSYTPLERIFESLRKDHPAVAAFRSIKLAKGQTLTGLCTTVTTTLSGIVDEKTNSISYTSDIEFDEIATHKCIVYIVTPGERPAKGAYASIFVTQLYQSLVSFAKRNGGQLPMKVQVLMEEAGGMKHPIPDFQTMLGESRKYGINFHVCLQNYTQLDVLYGPMVSRVIQQTINTKILLKTNDMQTAADLAKRIGQYSVSEQVVSSSSSKTSLIDGSVSTREQSSREDYLSAADILSWNPEWGTLVWRDLLDRRQGFFGRLVRRCDKVEVGLYPTANIKHLPTARILDIYPKSHLAEKTQRVESSSKITARLLVTPWEVRPGANTKGHALYSSMTEKAYNAEFAGLVVANIPSDPISKVWVEESIRNYPGDVNPSKYVSEQTQRLKEASKRQTKVANRICQVAEQAAGLDPPWSFESEGFRRQRAEVARRWVAEKSSDLEKKLTITRFEN